jgi:hypothetical protein
MFKYLIPILILLLLILPVNAVDTCPTCPVPTPHIVYVTVTVTVPVPQTLPPTSLPTPTPIPIPTQDQNIITKFTGVPEYGIYGLLFLLLIGGVVFMKIKQRKKGAPKISKIQTEEPQSDKYGNLYEEDEPQQIELPKQIIEEEPSKKPKKPKKPVSLLDKDFEF